MFEFRWLHLRIRNYILLRRLRQLGALLMYLVEVAYLVLATPSMASLASLCSATAPKALLSPAGCTCSYMK